jgi:hypothetical protein
MRRIKNFGDYVNEANTSSVLASIWNDAISGMNSNTDSGSSDPSMGRLKKENVLDKTPGNDDYLIYLQHQQGAAGVAGLVKAMNGTGKLHPDTIKTKKGKKYANLMGNIPSDISAEVKKSIESDLDNGDQKSAATKFTNIWKEKFNKAYSEANKKILDPKYSKISKAIMEACIETGVPFDFAVTVAYIESKFDPNAVSYNGRYKGLFQMDPNNNYGGEVGVVGSNWSNPDINADKGVKLISLDLKNFKKILGSSWASLKMGDWTKKIA